MPELTRDQRAAGGYAHAQVELDWDRDWSIPTDAETLRRRPMLPPDQSRYGKAKA